MATTYSTNYSRLPGTNVRSFLLRCTNGPLAGVGQRELHLVADDYEHARHRHEKFGQVIVRTVCELDKGNDVVMILSYN